MKKLTRTLIALVALGLLILPVAEVLAQSTFVAPRVHGRFIGVGSGTAPVLSSCGTSPTIAGNDTVGKITIGTGTPSACTVTFNEAFTAAPTCYAVDETTAAKNPITTASTTTAVVLTLAAASVNGDVIAYMCMGR